MVESGRDTREEIPVQALEDQQYQALVTPALANGFAADDVIALDDRGFARVIARGGNVGVQLFASAHDCSRVEALVDEAEALGGWMDGFDQRVIVVTFPIWVGFAAIETVVQNFYAQASATEPEWMYANVYEADGETPIGWWEQPA